MSDLISRAALVEEFEWLKANTSEINRAELEEHIQRIKNAPAVDAEPVRHGKWGAATIIGYDGLHPIYARPCSACKYEIECRFEQNYCPNCGAKMDGEG